MADQLPVLPAWQARSFWLTIIGAASALGAALGFDLFAFFGVEGEGQLADAVMQIVAAVAIIWAWFERKAPHYRLKFGSAPKHPDETTRNPVTHPREGH